MFHKEKTMAIQVLKPKYYVDECLKAVWELRERW